MEQIEHWIGGVPTAGTSGRVGPVFNPATGQQIAEVALASTQEVGRAVGERSRSRRSESIL